MIDRNKESVFRDFYTFYYKDWFVSGARSRLSVPARSIYLELIGLVYTEGGIVNDAAVLMRRLGVGAEYAADMDAALAEFEPSEDGDNKLTHPRVLKEIVKLAKVRDIKRKAGMASAAARTQAAVTRATTPAKPEPGRVS